MAVIVSTSTGLPVGSSPIIMNGEKTPDSSDRAGRRLVLTPAGRFATVNGRFLHLTDAPSWEVRTIAPVHSGCRSTVRSKQVPTKARPRAR
jgi:hypothetical protein